MIIYGKEKLKIFIIKLAWLKKRLIDGFKPLKNVPVKITMTKRFFQL